MGSMWGEIGGAATSDMGANWEIGMSVIGRLMAQGDIDKANQVYQTILNSVAAVDIPAFNKMMAQEVPGADKIIGAGQGRTAQSSALNNLESFVNQGGNDAQARQAQEQALGQADQHEQANRGAIMQSAARRGMSGSGGELLSMLQGNQASANQARSSSLDIAGQSRQRALDALGKQAQIGGQMRGQDIDVESKNMAAENARQQFNARMRYSAAQSNNDLLNEDFHNRMAKENALNSARRGVAGRYDQSAKRTQGDMSSFGRAMNYKHQSAAEGWEDMME